MKKIKTILALMLFIVGVIPEQIKAKDMVDNNRITIIETYYPSENFDVKVAFIDEELVDNNEIKPYGAIQPQYSHSYYTYYYKTVSSYNVGPRHNDLFLISVARGETHELGETKTISGSIVFEGTVETKIKQAINIGLGLTASGTYSKTFASTTTYTLSDSASCNSRSFYSAIDYDLTTVYVKRYDVYNNVDQSTGAITGTETVYHSTIATSNIKVPKVVNYSIDHY